MHPGGGVAMRFMLCLLLVAIAAFAYTMGSGTGAYRTMPLQGEVLWGLELQELLVLVAAVAVILIVLPGVLGSYRGRTGRAVRDILGWAVIAMLGVGAYNYRDELGQIAFRITGEQAAREAVVAGAGLGFLTECDAARLPGLVRAMYCRACRAQRSSCS